MDFSTRVNIPKSDFQIDYSTRTMLFGSCFSENIGNRLIYGKFRVNANPFGILYNPASISVALNRLLDGNNFTADDLVFHNHIYQSFLHHGAFSHPDMNICLKNISDSFSLAERFLRETDLFLFTFGTAYIFKLKSSGKVVGNCHKFPSETLTRERLAVEEIVQEWSEIIEKLLAINPSAKFVFTVSPIRHWKDGAHENQLSKSILHLAIDKLQEKFTAPLSYFPAYEILLDELRDYRFFAEDMMHPSSVAVDYIWQRFRETYFSSETENILEQWSQIKRALNHRPIYEGAENFKQFTNNTLQKLQVFQQKYPHINCSNEIEQLKQRTEL